MLGVKKILESRRLIGQRVRIRRLEYLVPPFHLVPQLFVQFRLLANRTNNVSTAAGSREKYGAACNAQGTALGQRDWFLAADGLGRASLGGRRLFWSGKTRFI